MSNDQPPLTHPVTNALIGDDFEDLYTTDQMLEYGRARERAAYERINELIVSLRNIANADPAIPDSRFREWAKAQAARALCTLPLED